MSHHAFHLMTMMNADLTGIFHTNSHTPIVQYNDTLSFKNLSHQNIEDDFLLDFQN